MARASLIGRGRRKLVQMSLLAQSAGNNFQKHGRTRGRWFCVVGKKTKNRRICGQVRFEKPQTKKKNKKKERGKKEKWRSAGCRWRENEPRRKQRNYVNEFCSEEPNPLFGYYLIVMQLHPPS